MWQIVANYGEFLRMFAGKGKILVGVGGMGPGRSENPNSEDLCSPFDTLPHPEGWATDPSRFAIAAERRFQNNLEGSENGSFVVNVSSTKSSSHFAMYVHMYVM